VIARPRLLARLRAGREVPTVTVVAPAGYGTAELRVLPLTLADTVEVSDAAGLDLEVSGEPALAEAAGAAGMNLGLVAALALRRPFRGRGVVRACMLLPYVAPVVAATFLWRTMLNSQFGVVNHYGTTLLGWNDPIAFLSSSDPPSIFGLHLPISTAMLTVVFFEAWRSFPFAFLFLTARMEAIPDTLDEAAIVDGAAPSQRFRHIVLPQLLPTIAVLTVLRFIWTFNNFDDIFLLTRGAAKTQVVTVRVYDYLINKGDIGAAAAQALVLAVILAVLVGVYLKFFGRQEEVA
jgi:multiple sugar transport system permease protein